MTTPFMMQPYIYKKGKILNIKKLNEGSDSLQRKYIFSGYTGNQSLTTLISSTNNLNQITGRILLGCYKLLSYFGLSKDPSEELSKTRSVYDKFSTLLERGNNQKLEDVITLLIEQNRKIDRIEEKINHLGKISIDRNEVLDFTSKLNEIEEYLKKILG